LLYHAIGAEVDSTAAVAAAGTTVEMANGDSVGISVVDGNVYINNAMVTVVDIEAVNGVVHVIDTVLMPPMPNTDNSSLTIAEIAVAAGDFDTLVAALTAADLVAPLSDANDTYTVFAPTDAAFAAIPEATLDAILANTETLSAILLQHVIADSAVDSSTAYSLNGMQATMASGAMLDIAIMDGVLTIGGANITVTDIVASNGIIHVIDSVIVGDVTLP
jgi:uncharacterized surface protein with fasciclin (FAS1) repeats